MKMDKVASSQNDEFYTPEYAIKPILKYIKMPCTIWCPFDTEESNFVKLLSQYAACGVSVIHSHIATGGLFQCVPPACDYIISNPPYSVKGQVLQRLFDIGKPFAMLVGVVGLFESQERFEMFRENEFEIMYFNRRVAYFQSYQDPKPSLNPPFSSVYVCHKMLPERWCLRKLRKDRRLTIETLGRYNANQRLYGGARQCHHRRQSLPGLVCGRQACRSCR